MSPASSVIPFDSVSINSAIGKIMKFLKPGDRIDITIEPIGTLSNQIG
jgi:2-keto-4-pentenoate hydratase/2-oxohepta-3-ene-1,7-dioic acid hydratase in catechol pathway